MTQLSSSKHNFAPPYLEHLSSDGVGLQQGDNLQHASHIRNLK